MDKLPEIASLWIGGELSWLEQLCLKSFVDAGHHTTLYSYAPIENVPMGVHTADAAEILSGEPLLRHARTGSPAIHADMWRLQLLRKTDKIWVDADMYCLRPFDFNSEYVFGWEKPGLVCNAVLGLPKDSSTLAKLVNFFEDEYAIAPWLTESQQHELRLEKDAGRAVHMTEQNWGFTGPASVTHFLQETGEISHAHPQETFYPISFKHRNHLIISKFKPEEEMTENTRGVHFWARRMKPRLEEKEGNVPRRGSFMAELLRKHNIEPSSAPIPTKIVKQHEKSNDPEFRKQLGTEALQHGVSIDSLSRKYLVETRFVKVCRDEILSNIPTGSRAKSKNDAQPINAENLDYSAFTDDDFLNLTLQRSEVLFDIPRYGRLIKEWSKGTTTPLKSIILKKGIIIAERSVRIIGDEFENLRPVLDQIGTNSIADIGCGYGLFDMFMAATYNSKILLIDLENNDKRNFGFSEEGAAYSNLSTAVNFLKANDVDPRSIKKMNPEKEDILSAEPVDLAVSFLACGFHFPVNVYLPFFEKKVKPGGHIILDLRKSAYAEQSKALAKLGDLTILDDGRKKRRVMVKKFR